MKFLKTVTSALLFSIAGLALALPTPDVSVTSDQWKISKRALGAILSDSTELDHLIEPAIAKHEEHFGKGTVHEASGFATAEKNQVAAVLEDEHGVHHFGFNDVNKKQHAEDNAIEVARKAGAKGPFKGLVTVGNTSRQERGFRKVVPACQGSHNCAETLGTKEKIPFLDRPAAKAANIRHGLPTDSSIKRFEKKFGHADSATEDSESEAEEFT